MVFATLNWYYQTISCRMELLCITKGELSMVHIHLISLNQGGLTGALTVFIVIPFFACAEGRGSSRGGEVSTQAVLFIAEMSFVS